MVNFSGPQLLGVLIIGLILGGFIGFILNSIDLFNTSNPLHVLDFIIVEGFVVGFLFMAFSRLSGVVE